MEKHLADIPELNYTILRLPLVYGLGDKSGLTPRLMAAAIYKHLGETMKLLWSADMKLNTVHVTDVCSAIWFVCNRHETIGQVCNFVLLKYCQLLLKCNTIWHYPLSVVINI